MSPKSTLPLTKFYIAGLHGDRDVTLNFTSPATIINADNGAGKTTVLNVLFRILEGNWFKLFRTCFSYVELTFGDSNKIRIDYELLSNSKHFGEWLRQVTPIRRKIPELELQQLYLYLLSASPNRDPEEDPFIREIARKLDIPLRMAVREFIHMCQMDPSEMGDKTKLIEKFNAIKKHIDCQVLYLPTYRRVEEDIVGITIPRESPEEQIIQFGMHDVEDRINRITSEIKDSALRWSTQVNGDILTELINEIQVDESTYMQITDVDTVGIVLDRTNRSSEKPRIVELIESGQIRDEKRKPLAYFLGKLIQIYTQQKDKDNSIKSLVTTCNHYLRDNKLHYDESKVEVTVVNRTNPDIKVTFGSLSSGEKQIVSVFSKLYLDIPDKCALIIDEPELSLSIEWQKRFLPDILATGKCDFLLAATHSPFIFSNELDEVATDMTIKFRSNHDVCR